MKKVIISIILGIALFLGAVFAYSNDHPVLAVFLLFVVLSLSCLFEEGRNEIHKDDDTLEDL